MDTAKEIQKVNEQHNKLPYSAFRAFMNRIFVKNAIQCVCCASWDTQYISSAGTWIKSNHTKLKLTPINNWHYHICRTCGKAMTISINPVNK